MLQGVEAQIRQIAGFGPAGDAEDPAMLFEPVAQGLLLEIALAW
jgi:hypothetical protein